MKLNELIIKCANARDFVTTDREKERICAEAHTMLVKTRDLLEAIIPEIELRIATMKLWHGATETDCIQRNERLLERMKDLIA